MTIAQRETPMTGRCLCGRVRFRVTEDPIAFYACHCTDCRRECGTAYGLTMLFRRSAVEHVGGEVRSIGVRVESGRIRHATLCTECLVRVWSESAATSQVLGVRFGALDDASDYTPFGNMWLASACPWAEPVPGPRFDRQPEDPIAMVRIWAEERRRR